MKQFLTLQDPTSLSHNYTRSKLSHISSTHDHKDKVIAADGQIWN